jgi:ABC-type bacteriocin/lantibiotic exporter with double-glycine peptidase domain
MQVKGQDKEYNCGPFAINFILGLFGMETNTNDLEKMMNCSEQNGVSHVAIRNALSNFGLSYSEHYDATISELCFYLPAIINYQYFYEGEWDGHYSVAIGKGEDYFIIYNPATGEIEKLSFGLLDDTWYSEKYGQRWLIHPKKSAL